MNLTRHGLLIAALVGIGAPALIGYAGNRRVDSRLNAACVTPPASAPQPKARRSTPVERPQVWQAVRPDLFAGAAPEQPIPPAPPAAHAAESTPPVVSAPTPPPDPLADYVYSGTVTVDGRMSALIEQRKSRAGWYVHEGEPWQSYRILNVDANAITVEVNGERRTLPKSDAINVVPLVTDAGKSALGSASEASKNLYQTLITTASNNLITFQLNTAGTPAGLSAAEIARIKEDAFDGRISADEADRRLNQGNTGNALSFQIAPINFSLSYDSAPQ